MQIWDLRLLGCGQPMEGGKRLVELGIHPGIHPGIRLGTTDVHTHTPSQKRPASRTDGGNGDSDRGDKQRGEIWRQEEAGSQNKSGGSRGMEDRMKLTDIKTARTHRELSLPDSSYTEISGSRRESRPRWKSAA